MVYFIYKIGLEKFKHTLKSYFEYFEEKLS